MSDANQLAKALKHFADTCFEGAQLTFLLGCVDELNTQAAKIAEIERDAARYQWLSSREADGRYVPAGQREMVYKVWNLLTDEQDEMPGKEKIDAAIDAAISLQEGGKG